jgi:hypothetical protein
MFLLPERMPTIQHAIDYRWCCRVRLYSLSRKWHARLAISGSINENGGNQDFQVYLSVLWSAARDRLLQ